MQSSSQVLPAGTITFLFTDIEGSTPLWERDPAAMQQAVARHHAILRTTAQEHGGSVFKTVGDAFQIAFPFSGQALRAALAAQRALAAEPWGATGPLRVRMGLHTGPAQVVDGDYAVSHTLNRVARIASAGHGGQILLSLATEELLRGQLPEGVQLLDLGEHILKGLTQPERIFQVVAPDLPQDLPPLVSEPVRGHNPPSELLRTKLFVPLAHGLARSDPSTGVRARLVSRPRLVEQLSRGLRSGCKLSLISAPAGFGKTTLVGTWLSESRCRAGWISLDSGDNDPVRFLRYLIAALRAAWQAATQAASQAVEPPVGQATERLLRSPQLPPLESVLTVLLNELCALPDQVVLVLDDYHLITAAEVHQVVTFMLEHLPPQVHIVLLTRADPPLPLTRLRARNQLVELRAAHLRFTRDEVAAFLNQVMGLVLSAGDVAAMEASTEGWIAGLQLAAVALQSRLAV